MATQADRRARTQAAVVRAATRLFGRRGFEATTMDQIATAASVAKGAVYHYFATKEGLFEAVFEQVSEDLAREIAAAARAEPDVLAAMVAAIQHYFDACSTGVRAQVILRDGPAVLGWARWREIDEKHFGGGISRALEQAMRDGLVARQPVEPLARLLLGAVTEAAMACAGRPDLATAGADYTRAVTSLIEGLRRR
jgi:AcrR family transcriptional regulator